MEKRSTLKYINLNDLKLDLNNPRFGELYNGSSAEDDLIKYLLYEEAAEEIAKAIVKSNEFYEDKALWVIKDTDEKYLVRDGNRRCAAVKALQMPGKYELSHPKTSITKLPVYEYMDANELQLRIGQEHAASLFRNWERIAKALQILELADSGKHDIMNSLDSRPGDFIKLGSFYTEAVKYGGDDLRKQLRRGRGKTGGKTIIYERLFRDAKLCGYKFKNAPFYKIEITDQSKFESYIESLVAYIEANPETKTSDLDGDNNKSFIKNLKDFGFDAYPKASGSNGITGTGITGTGITDTGGNATGGPGGNGPTESAGGAGAGSSNTGTTQDGSSSGVPGTGSATSGASSGSGSGSTRGTVKKYPDIKRKKLPAGLKARIDEYFKVLDSNTAPNAKIAMARVLFECVMKFIIEETKYNGRTLIWKSSYFGPVYSDTRYTDFKKMKHKFIDLIKPGKDRNAMTSFDFEHLHQVVHNYKVNGISTVGDQVSSNLIELVEFMLQDEVDLLNSLDLTKL
ncbi:MAG: hypothetical protein H7Z76_16115 [Methylotenera sp.]|nr:hypothetical protein [Flavobacterium sp.]